MDEFSSERRVPLYLVHTFLLREWPELRPAARARAGGVLEPGGTCSGVGGHSTAWLPTSGLPTSGLWKEELPAGGGAKLAERAAGSAIFWCVNLLPETQILDKSENFITHTDCT
jgi:hypothetical protein